MEQNRKKKLKRQLADQTGIALDFMFKLLVQLIDEIEEQGEIDECGDLDIEKDFVYEEVIQDEKITQALESILDTFWDEATEQAKYQKRQAWQEQRDRERTDRRAFIAEKNRVANKINKKYN
jgi:hypothetical protein